MNGSLEKFRDRHQGERCFVIGCAPSLAKLEVAKLRGEWTFSVNRGYLAGQLGLPQSSYYVVGDPHTYREYWQEIRQAPVGQRFYKANVFNLPEYQGAADREPALCVPFHNAPTMDEGNFSADPTLGIYRGFTVVLDAVQLAYFMGFAEVYIIGCDLNYAGDQTHVYGTGAYEQKRRNDMPIEKVLRAMAVAGDFFQRHGRRFANAGVGGCLDTIPRVEFSSLFSRRPAHRANQPTMKSLRINFPMALLREETPLCEPGEVNPGRKLGVIDRRAPFLLLYQSLTKLGHQVGEYEPGECDLNFFWTSKRMPESERAKSIIMEVAWLPRWHYQVSPTGSNYLGHYARRNQFDRLTAPELEFIKDYLTKLQALFAQAVDWQKVARLRSRLTSDFVLFAFQLANDLNLKFSGTEFARLYTPADDRNAVLAQACIDKTVEARSPLPILFKQHPCDMTPDFKGRLNTDQWVLDNSDDFSPHEIFATGRCKGVISINSNTVHEATAWNIPAVCLGKLIWDSSAAMPPYSSRLDDLERIIQSPPHEDVTVLAYLHYLVRNQWMLSDFQNLSMVAELLRTRGGCEPMELRQLVGLPEARKSYGSSSDLAEEASLPGPNSEPDVVHRPITSREELPGAAAADPSLREFVSHLAKLFGGRSLLQIDWNTAEQAHLTAYDATGEVKALRSVDGIVERNRLRAPDACCDTVFNLASLNCVCEGALAGWLEELYRVTGKDLWVALAPVPGRDRAWWEARFLEAGFRKHPLAQRIVSFEAIAKDDTDITLLLEKIPPTALKRYPLATLKAERDLHMDMLREAGARSDAHIARYQLAADHTSAGGLIVDAACGLGYGSAILARQHPDATVIGIDNSGAAIRYAKEHFAGGLPNLEFYEGDVCDFGFLGQRKIDFLVSFETIEHIPDPCHFLAEALRHMSPYAGFVGSVPNLWVDERGNNPSPFHLHVFDYARFKALLQPYWKSLAVYRQNAERGVKGDHGRLLRQITSDTPGSEDLAEAEWWIIASKGETKAQLAGSVGGSSSAGVPKTAFQPVAPPVQSRSDLLLLPTGISQFATMIATLRQLDLDARGARVLSIISCFTPAMDLALRKACELWGCCYGGNFWKGLNEWQLDAAQLSGAERERWERNPAQVVSERLLAVFPELVEYRGARTVIPARPNMPEDFYILSALNPTSVHLIADGIQNETILRNHTGSAWRGFNRELASFPTAFDVWCPDYLARDTAGIGHARILDASVLSTVYAELADSPIGMHLRKQVMACGEIPRAIVLSQHFALSGLCSEEEEFEYYSMILERMRQAATLPVLFKRHPRDPAAKTERLLATAAKSGLAVGFTDDLASCVPIECLQHLWADREMTVVGSSSSAVLGLQNLSKAKTFCADSLLLPDRLRRQIVFFSAKNSIPRLTLERSTASAAGHGGSTRPVPDLLVSADRTVEESAHDTAGNRAKRGSDEIKSADADEVQAAAEDDARHTVLFVSHEASRSGAPIYLLRMLRWLRAETDMKFRVLLGRGGPLESEFHAVAETFTPETFGTDGSRLADVSLIYSNTCTNGALIESLGRADIPIVTHVHELEGIIEVFGLEGFKAVRRHTAHYVACSQAVADNLIERHGIPASCVTRHYGSIPVAEVLQQGAVRSRADVRRELGVDEDAVVFAACGRADWRKGADVFLQVAAALKRRADGRRKLAFRWIGFVPTGDCETTLRRDARLLGVEESFRFVGEVTNAPSLLGASDVFCLTSREDPFPLVMLEAGALGKPVVAFERSGGAQEYCRFGAGLTVPYLDVEAYAEQCLKLVGDEALRRATGDRGAALVRESFDEKIAGPRWLDMIRQLLAQGLASPVARQAEAERRREEAVGLFNNGDIGAARDRIARGMECRPDDPESLRCLGMIEFQSGDLGAAAAAFRRLIAEAPHDAAAHAQLAMLFVQQDRVEDARDLALKALTLDPNHEDALRLGAAILKRDGQFREAADLFARLRRIRPTDVDARVGAAECLTVLGQRNMAATLMSEVLELDPANEEARAALVALRAVRPPSMEPGPAIAAKVSSPRAVNGTAAKSCVPPRPLETHRVGSRAEFEALWHRVLAPAIAKQNDAAPLAAGVPFTLSGFCAVCGKPSRFQTDYMFCGPANGARRTPSWRERQVCSCGLNCRQRSCYHLLTQTLGLPKQARVYCTEQTTPLFRRIAAAFPAATGSEFLGQTIPLGATTPDGIRNEDLTRLTFADDSLECVFSLDVLEHVPDYKAAISEIVRCLKPGGTLLLTAPFHFGADRTVIRSRFNSEGGLEHLLPPVYHGDPINDKGCLCFNDFGWDLLDLIRSRGLPDAALHVFTTDAFGYIGLQYAMLGHKPSHSA